MSVCEITLSANAGIALQFGSLRMWSDALHTEKVPGFSTVSPALAQAIRRDPHFAAPDLIFYTHCHPDHYSRALTEEAAARYPMAELVLPRQEFRHQLLLTGREMGLNLCGVSLRFRRLVHEGEQYAAVPHYGCLLERRGFRILLPGDCAIANPELADFAGETPVDLLAVDFPWVTLRRGREFIEEQLRPRRLLIYHLPFREDNDWGYRELTAKAARQMSIPDIRLLMDPLHTEVYE